MAEKTLVVVDHAGGEHHFVEDDEYEFWHRYGRDHEDQGTHEHELRIYRNAGKIGPPVVVAVFFHPRYIKEFWG